MNFSKVQKIDLRTVWKHEAFDFTQWLAQPENLDLLSDEIGIELSLIETEASVGNFNVDIFAEEEGTGRKVVIENQLEMTDHDHLGKIITYASGLDTEIIVWIVKGVRDEHKQAVDWLNEHTNDKINLFAIQMELWQIDGSPYAPKFNVVAKPNDWAKAVKKAHSRSELSDTKLLQLEFWTSFKEYFLDKQPNAKLRKCYPRHWHDISVGSSDARVTLTTKTQTNEIGCELYIIDSKELYAALEAKREAIESELGVTLEWHELPQKKASRIKLLRNADIMDKDQWQDCHAWLMDKALQFQTVFGHHISQ